jgi:small subunit ribosomal protein S5
MTTEQLAATAFYEDSIIDPRQLELYEEVVHINRVSKVVKGGRRFTFCALVIVGDKHQHVGIGYGKAKEVPEAIRKAGDRAKRSLIRVPLRGRTIPYLTTGEHCSTTVMMRPASTGTGVIAGRGVRTVLELAGVHDILTKCHGSNNIINVVRAAFDGLASIRDARHLARLRGKELSEIVGGKFAAALVAGPSRDAYEDEATAATARTYYDGGAGNRRGGAGSRRPGRDNDAPRGGAAPKAGAPAAAKAEAPAAGATKESEAAE